tara:strand:+ start:1441 stop:1677 length:237 start_codon:yes stop_codon:yes gene_type:complete
MAKYGKYRSQQELLEATQGGVYVLENLEDIIKDIQDVRKRLNKPEELKAKDAIDHDLRSWLVGLNKVVKQLKRNKNLN